MHQTLDANRCNSKWGKGIGVVNGWVKDGVGNEMRTNTVIAEVRPLVAKMAGEPARTPERPQMNIPRGHCDECWFRVDRFKRLQTFWQFHLMRGTDVAVVCNRVGFDLKCHDGGLDWHTAGMHFIPRGVRRTFGCNCSRLWSVTPGHIQPGAQVDFCRSILRYCSQRSLDRFWQCGCIIRRARDSNRMAIDSQIFMPLSSW